jgi:hypothetical protein
MLAFGATAVGVVALTACGGGGNTAPSYIAPPQPAAQAGQITLSNTTSQQQLPTSGGYGGVISWPVGSGTVDTSLSTTAPSNVEVVTPSAVRRQKASAGPTVVYLTISSTAGATLNGFPPAVGLTTPTAESGPWQEAEYSSTVGTWTNLETGAAKGDAVSFPGGKQTITLAAGGSVTLAFYPGLYPEPTPTPTPTPEATPTNFIADPNFDSGTQVVYTAPSTPPVPTSAGWTQCSITSVATPPPTTPINHPVSAYTPDPGATPAAVVMQVGTSLQVGSSAPHPTVTVVPTYNGAQYAAVFGSLFSNYYAEDFKYDGLCQALTMPLGATLSMEILANGNDGDTYLSFDVDWLNSSGQFVANLYSDDATDPITGTSAGDSAYRLISIPNSVLAPYLNQKGELFIGVWVDAGSGSGSTKYSTYYFVDNVNLQGIPQ